MLLDLNDVLYQSGQSIRREIHLDAGRLGDIELAAPVDGSLRVQNARQNLVISGNANTAVWVSCDRCLKRFIYELRLNLEATAPLSLFQIPGQIPVSQESFFEDDEVDEETRALFNENDLNISELVRQSIWLQMPIKLLCSTECQGLLQSTGTQDMIDARLDGLKQWSERRH